MNFLMALHINCAAKIQKNFDICKNFTNFAQNLLEYEYFDYSTAV